VSGAFTVLRNSDSGFTHDETAFFRYDFSMSHLIRFALCTLALVPMIANAAAATNKAASREQIGQRIEQAIVVDDSAALEEALQAYGTACESGYSALKAT
jgi:hypothetical protein